MRLFTVNIHGADQETKDRLQSIEAKLTQLLSQGVQIMAQNAELKTFLDQLNTYTNEIASDIDDLLAKVAAGQTLSDEDRAAMSAVADTLRNVAAKHETPLPPPVEPPPA